MLDLLKSAARVGTRTESRALPQDILSFCLEYEGRPDLAAERGRLAGLLGADGFDLFPYSEADDPDLLVLQFPGVPRQQSPDFLFEEAQALTDALGLRSVTPDIDPPYHDVETVPPATEGFGDLVWSLCSSDAAAPADPAWAVRLIRADGLGVTGAGIRIGQPDTGVAEHRELGRGIAANLGWNFVDDAQDPTDPLSPSMRSPGHGTGTSSVVASRASHAVTGSAPGATLVPIRAVDSVIIGSGVSVARAVDHARANGCHVVTMSLGGPIEGAALRRAIGRAVDAGMIVLAAAGNCVGLVTYPAWDPNVVAVAAVDENKRRWRGSCFGRAVDIAAPGENVHVARRLALAPGQAPSDEDLAVVDQRGQGTSYAVALTAGVAALWLERWGVAAVRAEAARRGVRVQALFRAALRASAQVPPGWDTSDMGAGIVDARALLDLALADVPGAPAPESGNPALALFGEDFVGGRFEAEASFVAADWRVRAGAEAAPIVERALPAAPSPQLAARLALTTADSSPPAPVAAPAAILSPAAPPVPLDSALRRIAVGRRGQLESADAVSFEGAVEAIRAEGTDSLVEAAREAFRSRAERAPERADPDVQAEALGRIERALDQVVRPAGGAAIPDAEARVVLEALVRLTGRPAIRVHADGSEIFDPLLGDWAADLVPRRGRWQRLTDAVGRVDVEISPGRWAHAGTGFLVADGLVMTNRHVLDTFAEPLPAPAGEQRFLMRRRASIVFDPEAADEATRFAIPSVVTAGRHRIGRTVDLGSLDMAVLAMDPDNGRAAPPPAIDGARVSTVDPGVEKVLVAGFPAKPGAGQAPPASDQANFLAFWERIGELYGDEYGVKYMSPGLILARPGAVAGDPRGWAFTHDATTLAGNSGSAIVSLHGDMGFCGLHFGGQTLTQNLAHDIERVVALGDGVFATGALGGGP